MIEAKTSLVSVASSSSLEEEEDQHKHELEITTNSPQEDAQKELQEYFFLRKPESSIVELESKKSHNAHQKNYDTINTDTDENKEVKASDPSDQKQQQQQKRQLDEEDFTDTLLYDILYIPLALILHIPTLPFTILTFYVWVPNCITSTLFYLI